MTPQEFKAEFIRRYINGDEYGIEGNTCVYRTFEGKNCAVGLLLEQLNLPDEHPIWVENVNPTAPMHFLVSKVGEAKAKEISTVFDLVVGCTGLSREDLNILQNIHDVLAYGTQNKLNARIMLNAIIPDKPTDSYE